MMRLYGRAATGHNDPEQDNQGSHDDGDGHGRSPRNAYGFDLHAGVHTAAQERSRLERLCRYLLRPPLSNDRLSEAGPGRYAVRLKTPWRDGTTGIVLGGVELLACGTCLDFFHLKERLRAGKVSNMFEIASRLVAADRVVRP